MKLKKLFSLMLVAVTLFTLIGCANKNEAEQLWNNYVEAANKKDLDSVAKMHSYLEYDIDKFKTEQKTYFDGLEKIETVSFEILHEADFSSEINTEVYYIAKVVAEINAEQRTFKVYIKSNNFGIFFSTTIQVLDIRDGEANTPDDYFLKKMYYTSSDYLYKFSEDQTTASYLQYTNNKKNVVIPSKIDGKPVTAILRDAFLNVSKFLSFSRPKSKLETIVLPDTLKTIGDRAFYQCTNLKEITIPASVRTISTSAFASCTSVKKITILGTTIPSSKADEKVFSSGTGGLYITGAKNILTGEIINLKCLNSSGQEEQVKWSLATTSAFVTLDVDTGEVTGALEGKVDIVATSKRTGDTARVTINVENCEKTISIAISAFNRMNSLTEVYISCYNPLSIEVANPGSLSIFNFNSNVKIYVPRGSLKMYQTNANWSAIKNQIFEK